MEYEPKVFVNKTGHNVEFFCGGRLFIFKAGEQKPLNGDVSYHVIHHVNTGLTIVGEDVSPKLDVDVENMSWKQLRQMVDKKGKKIYEMGMNKSQLVAKIKQCLA